MNRRKSITAAGIVVLISAVVYLPILRNGFVIQDDPDWIASNPWLNPPSWYHLTEIWQRPMQGLYVPVTYSLWEVLALLGTKPIIFHAASLILHAISAWVVLRILNKLVPNPWAAMGGALLFAVHPLQVESVAWASGMKDVLAGLLSLVMIDQYLAHMNPQIQVKRAQVHYGFAILALTLGLLAKPSAVMAPVIAGTIDWMLVRRSFRKMFQSILPMILMVIPCVIWSRQIQPSWAETITPLWTRPLIAGDSLAFYIEKLFWPMHLTVQYGLTPQAALASPYINFIWLFPLVLGALVWIVSRRLPLVRCGMIIFVLGLLPVLGFATFMFQLNSTVADHYVYLAMLGPALAAAGVVRWAFESARLATLTISGSILAVLTVATVFQQSTWRDSIALFTRATQLHPTDITAEGKLGLAYATAGKYDQAIDAFRRVRDANPYNSMSWFYLGQVLIASDRLDQANVELSQAARFFPSDVAIENELQLVRQRMIRPTTR